MYEQDRLWGTDLYEHLDWVYQHAASFCVLFASVDYSRKVWTNHERMSAQSRAFTEAGPYILPARFDDTVIPGLRPTVGYIDLRTTSPTQLVELIIAKLADARPEPLTNSRLAPPYERPAPARPAVANRLSGASVTPPVGRLPSAGLRGRGSVLKELATAWRDRAGRIQVVAGVGGVGKSATALAFCVELGRADREAQRRICWLSAADEASLTAGLVGLARRVGGSERDIKLIAETSPEAPDLLWSLIELTPRPWLIVVDNADDPSLLAAPRPYGSSTPTSVADGTGWIRPSPHGLVVVTSRVADPRIWGSRSTKVHRLEVLAESEASDVLLDLILENRGAEVATARRPPGPGRDETDAARELANVLGGLPLALHLAGSAIGSPYSSWPTISDYLHAYRATGVSMLVPAPDGPSGDDLRATVMHTWELTLDALGAKGLTWARSLLRLLSCFAAAVPIPADLVDPDSTAELLTGVLDPHQLNAPPTSAALRRAREALARTGLVDVVRPVDVDGDRGPSALVIHPLIAETNRWHLLNRPDEERTTTSVCVTATGLMCRAMTRLPPDDPGNWTELRLLAPHLRPLLGFVATRLAPADLRTLLDTCAQAVNFLELTGSDAAGEQLARQALSLTSTLHPDDTVIADLHFQLAHTFGNRGRWHDAEAEYRLVFESRSRALGADHPRTLSARHQLAWVMANLGKWQDAEAEYRQILAGRRAAHGDEHVRTLSARHQLAWVIGNLGKWSAAQAEFEDIRAIRERLLGAEHKDTLAASHWLAWVAGRQGRWAEAESGFRDVLDKRLRFLGPDHRDTLATRDRLAWAIGNAGRLVEAEMAYREVIDSRRRVLGPNHRDTLATRNQLAWVASRQGRWAEADRLPSSPGQPGQHPRTRTSG
jgi:tetratricopeptide (TPR) repeat protein